MRAAAPGAGEKIRVSHKGTFNASGDDVDCRGLPRDLGKFLGTVSSIERNIQNLTPIGLGAKLKSRPEVRIIKNKTVAQLKMFGNRFDFNTVQESAALKLRMTPFALDISKSYNSPYDLKKKII